MSLAGVTLTNPKDYWKGTDFIERKLGSVLDKKVASSTRQVLLDRIQFKEASKPDPFYNELKSQYKPLNSTNGKQQIDSQKLPGKKGLHSSLSKAKDGLPAPKVVLFERERIELNWRSVRKIGPGLYNLGNTCFLNSVIQVLSYTPPLVNYLATQEHGKTCKKVGFCMICELQRHVLRTFGHGQNEAIKPMAIIQKLKYIAKHLRFGHQEDSHEFLRYVVDGMQKSCLVGVHEKLDSYSKSTTMVHQVFGGFYRSQVTCEKCHHTSNTYDPLMEVLLDIKHANSIQKALHKLTSTELLNGDNMYLCPSCKCKVIAKKHLTVHRAPSVMTMCLKRFDCHSLFGSKVNKEVDYPEHLNLRPFMSKNQGPALNYKLYAVLVHSGYSCNSGHYYCFVKASNNAWYQMNDASVRQVGLKSVLSQQAYLLFYIRHAEKEKRNHVLQNQRPTHHGTQSQAMNGVNSWKSGNVFTKNTPKTISENVNLTDGKAIGQAVPRKSEYPCKAMGPQRPAKYGATMLPETRDKISFAINQPPPVQERQVSSTTTVDKSEDNAIGEQQDVKASTLAEKAPFSSLGVVGEEGSKDENQYGVVQSVGKPSEMESTIKHPAASDMSETEEQRHDIHATTKWKVTNAASLLPGGLVTSRERTPSFSSDVSIASKTGEWSVTDKTTTVDIGPRLPERQHAGWKVSSTDDHGDQAEIPKTESEKTLENSTQEEPRKKPKKRKHSKDKDEKAKVRRTDDETKLLSDGGRDGSGEEAKKKRHKRKKHKKKGKIEKSKSGSGTDSGSDSKQEERKRKLHKKSKKKKRKHRSGSREKNSAERCSASPRKESRRDTGTTKIVNKAKELLNNVHDVTTKKTKDRRPLVEYSDHTSSSDEEQGTTRDSKGSSRSDRERGRHRRKKDVKSRSSSEYSAPSRTDASHNRKHVVDLLLDKSRGTYNYGCQVDRWDNNPDDQAEDGVRAKSVDDTSKRKRDEWDDEYDRGKVKRVKKKDNFFNRTFPGYNAFQKEYDKKQMKHNGWHSMSPYRWHNRSYDRHSYRDRR